MKVKSKEVPAQLLRRQMREVGVMRIGFDNEKYLKLQAERILERMNLFGGKLYLEFGGKLFDDTHASRVLPGFLPDSKMRMLLQLKDQAEIVIAINANHIELNKRRGDLGITYDQETTRLIDAFRGIGLYVGSVVLTQYTQQPLADQFARKLTELGIRVYRHYPIANYPSDVSLIVSDNGYGKNDYIETTRPVVVVTAPGPGSGKMATCLSQLFHEHKRGILAGYAKYASVPHLESSSQASRQFGLRGCHSGSQRRQHDRPVSYGGLRQNNGQLQPGYRDLPCAGGHV